MLFTSGSEGTPKGVVLSHRNLLANRHQLATVIDVNPKDIVLNALPVFHSFGLTGGLLLPLFAGVRTFLYPSPLHYRTVPELAYGINATILFGTDTFLAGYARVADNYDFYSVRYVFAGAERVKPETRRVWFEKFGIRILEGYGATETAPGIAVNTPMHFKAGTVGRFLPGIEHRLEKVPGVEASGRLSVSGPNVMLGYLRAENPGVLQPPPDGWYDTGDIVDIDAEGFITIKGRVKRFAKIAGEMVPLGGVEELAGKAYPKSAHAVVALPDPKKGERLVLLTEHADAQRAQLDGDGARDGLAGDLRAASDRAREVDPLLGTGKIDYVEAAPSSVRNRTALTPTTSRRSSSAPQLWAVFGVQSPGGGHGTCLSAAGESMESFIRDVLFAFSSLRRQPAFAITAVLTIALGIGATSAIFSVVNAVLLRPLPYNDAARLGTVWSDLRNRNVVDFPLAAGRFLRLRNDADAVRRLCGDQHVPADDRRRRQGESEQVVGAARSRPTSSRCSATAFSLAATSSTRTARRSRRRRRAMRCRAPGAAAAAAAEHRDHQPRVLAAPLRRRRIDRRQVDRVRQRPRARSSACSRRGSSCCFRRAPTSIRVPTSWSPIASTTRPDRATTCSLRVVAKLKPGVTFDQAQSELDRLSADLRSRFPIKQTAEHRTCASSRCTTTWSPT